MLSSPVGLTNPTLSSVSCMSSTSCVVVGSATQPSGNPAFNSPGQNAVPFAEVLSGTTWTLSLLPTPAVSAGSQMTEVSCHSAGSCVAVGTYLDSNYINQSYVETLAGSTWSETTLSIPTSWGGSTPGGVSCPASMDCIVVGAASLNSGAVRSFSSSWNGATWTTGLLPSPAGGVEPGLTAISCTSSTACVAVGVDYLSTAAARNSVFAQNFDETLSGSTWTAAQLLTVRSSLQPSIYDVSCSASAACVAVGSFSYNSNSQYQDENGGVLVSVLGGGGSSHALVLSLSSTGWTRSLLADPPGPPVADLVSVSCATATSCVGVGVYDTLTDSGVLIGHSVGGTWSISQLPSPAGVVNYLDSISCPRGPTCVAVGVRVEAAGHSHALYATDTGGSWVTRELPAPARSSADIELSRVSCASSTFCLAVGEYVLAGAYRQFFEVLRHGTWTAMPVPDTMIKGKVTADVSDVSCSQDVCRAVGGTNSAGVIWTLTAKKWAVTQLKAPFKHGAMQLSLISCRSRYSCEAEGEVVLRGKAAQVVETLSGIKWRPRLMTPLTASADYFPEDLSCSPSGHCAVVFEQFTISSLLSGVGFTTQLRSTFGTSWSIDRVGAGADATQEAVNSVACPSRLACTAVGGESFVNGEQLPFVITGT